MTDVRSLTRKFIEENEDLIIKGDWDEVYAKSNSLSSRAQIELNRILERSGVLYTSILSKITGVPSYFLIGCEKTPSEINLSSNITRIEDYAFAYCDGPRSVIAGKSVSTIGVAAFLDCKNLSMVEILGNIATIPDSAFRGCGNLEEVILPITLGYVDYKSFKDCANLKEITLPENVYGIGDYVFQGCLRLSEITLPGDLHRIGAGAFKGCINLKDIYYNGTTAEWKGIDKEQGWKDYTADISVHCFDGDLSN